MLVRFFPRFGIVVKNEVICVSLGLPRLRNGLHKALLGDVHELLIDRRIRVHTQEFCVVFNLLVLWMILCVHGLLAVDLLNVLFVVHFSLLLILFWHALIEQIGRAHV